MKNDNFFTLSLVAFFILGYALQWNPWIKAVVILNSFLVLFHVFCRLKEVFFDDRK